MIRCSGHGCYGRYSSYATVYSMFRDSLNIDFVNIELSWLMSQIWPTKIIYLSGILNVQGKINCNLGWPDLAPQLTEYNVFDSLINIEWTVLMWLYTLAKLATMT